MSREATEARGDCFGAGISGEGHHITSPPSWGCDARGAGGPGSMLSRSLSAATASDLEETWSWLNNSTCCPAGSSGADLSFRQEVGELGRPLGSLYVLCTESLPSSVGRSPQDDAISGGLLRFLRLQMTLGHQGLPLQTHAFGGLPSLSKRCPTHSADGPQGTL